MIHHKYVGQKMMSVHEMYEPVRGNLKYDISLNRNRTNNLPRLKSTQSQLILI